MSTNQFRRYLDLLNEADDLVPPNTNVALPSAGTFSNDQALANAQAQQNSEPRCAVCGTPQSQHQNLQHQFVAGGAANRPEAVAQAGGASGGDRGRIAQLQTELKAAGANLGPTGPNRDGIDGDMGPLTTAAMAKYPQIAAKYADISGAPTQAATPAVDTSKVTAALNAIDTIIAKYKGKSKVSESKQRIYEADRPLSAKEYQARIAQNIPPDVAASQETPGFQQSKIQKGGYVPPAATPTQPVYNRFNAPSSAPLELAKAQPYTQAAATAEKGLLKGAGKMAGKAVPFVGTGLSLKDAYDRWQSGDRTGAVISALAGAGWLVPGPAGWALGGGLDAYNLYRDFQAPDVSSEDISAVQKNLKVVNDWAQVPANIAAMTPELKSQIANANAAGNALIKQASTPAQTQPVVPAAAPQLKDTADNLDKLLKKYNFESRQPRTLSEQLARDRDIVNEGVASTVGKWALGAVEPIARRTLQGAAIGAGAVGAVKGYQAYQSMTAPSALNPTDKAEFDRLVAELGQLVPDEAAYNALSPDAKQKFDQIVKRATAAKNITTGNK